MATANKAGKVAIYTLRHPETMEIRYIGKSIQPKTRLTSHIYDSGRCSYPVNRWVRKLASSGLTPVMAIEAMVDEDRWQDAEKDLIAKHRSSRLLNVTEGGEGINGVTFEDSPNAFVFKRLIARLELARRRSEKQGNQSLARLVSDAILAWREFSKSNPDEALTHVLSDERMCRYAGVPC